MWSGGGSSRLMRTGPRSVSNKRIEQTIRRKRRSLGTQGGRAACCSSSATR
jgi:hypothetical protein